VKSSCGFHLASLHCTRAANFEAPVFLTSDHV
jgi:hypothetical protein